MQDEDWRYVSSMSRFYKWWIKRYLDIRLQVTSDILPVVTGKLFDRMGIAYLERDHQGRDKDTYHFYLTYQKLLWTDCNTDGYTGTHLGIVWWRRLQEKNSSETERYAFYARENCPKISHVLAHELLRLKGREKRDYFARIHELWEKHQSKGLPYLYFDGQFKRVRKEDSYKFSTIDLSAL